MTDQMFAIFLGWLLGGMGLSIAMMDFGKTRREKRFWVRFSPIWAACTGVIMLIVLFYLKQGT